eukprot:1509240-Rhodomonas_salina.1
MRPANPACEPLGALMSLHTLWQLHTGAQAVASKSMVQARESAEGEDGGEAWMRASSTCAAPATPPNCPRTCTRSSRASDRIQPCQRATARKDEEPRAPKESRRVRKGHRGGPAA